MTDRPSKDSREEHTLPVRRHARHHQSAASIALAWKVARRHDSAIGAIGRTDADLAVPALIRDVHDAPVSPAARAELGAIGHQHVHDRCPVERDVDGVVVVDAQIEGDAPAVWRDAWSALAAQAVGELRQRVADGVAQPEPRRRLAAQHDPPAIGEPADGGRHPAL